MNHKPVFMLVAGVLLIGLLPGRAAAQDIFTTSDFRQDSVLWTSASYYRNNTFLEFLDMQVDNRYGETGTGAEDALDLTSPHDYSTAWEHYQALLAEAGGGTLHTFETMPNWSGRFIGGADRLDGSARQASIVSVSHASISENSVQRWNGHPASRQIRTRERFANTMSA